LANCAIVFQGLLRACPDEIGVYQFRHFGFYTQFSKSYARLAHRSFSEGGSTHSATLALTLHSFQRPALRALPTAASAKAPTLAQMGCKYG
jgi:hypothetical protein